MVNDVVFTGSIMVMSEHVAVLPVAELAEIKLALLAMMLEAEPPVELLLLGCGKQIRRLPVNLQAALRERGMAVELMDTGAACRTYNVLLAEGRRVAAVLIAV